MNKQYIIALLLIGLAGTALTQKQIAKKEQGQINKKSGYANSKVVYGDESQEMPTKFAELFHASGVKLNPHLHHTFFAPRDRVFTKEFQDKLAKMTQKEKKRLVSRHVVAGDIRLGSIAEGELEAKNIAGGNIEIEIDDGDIEVNDAHVVAADIMEDEGRSTVHLVDALLEDE